MHLGALTKELCQHLPQPLKTRQKAVFARTSNLAGGRFLATDARKFRRQRSFVGGVRIASSRGPLPDARPAAGGTPHVHSLGLALLPSTSVLGILWGLLTGVRQGDALLPRGVPPAGEADHATTHRPPCGSPSL